MIKFVIEADSAEAQRAAILGAARAHGLRVIEAMDDDEMLAAVRERMDAHGIAVPIEPISTVRGDPEFEAFCAWCDARGRVGEVIKSMGLWRAELFERDAAPARAAAVAALDAEEELGPA